MKSYSLLSAAALLLLCGCKSTAPETTEISLFDQPGFEKTARPDADPETFLPWSTAVKPHGGSKLFKNPKKLPLYTVDFAKVPLSPGWIYELNMKFVGQEGTALHLYGTEFSGEKPGNTHVLLRTRSALNVNGATGYSKEFAISPGSTGILPHFLIASAGKSGHVNELLVENLSIRKIAPMKQASPEIKKINLASAYDFSKHPEGEFTKMCRGMGANAKHWSNVKAEVVKIDGESMLHIVRKPENYIYPWMDLNPFPIDPRYHYVRLSFQIKGSGAVSPGLWWKRRTLQWDYYHGKKVELTNDWQTVTLVHPCMTPDVKSATMSFSSSGDGEFWIKNISVTME